jgi:2'-hydroxyisoflavone reductase
MRLLILGGTWFLGRSLAEQALAHGWHVTTFSRGRTGHDVEGTEPIRGDRTRPSDLQALATAGRWDAVVDTSGYVPAMVTTAATALRAVADRYIYISTVNAYLGWPDEPLTDESPTFDATAEMTSDAAGADQGLASPTEYGQLKAACELAATQQFQNGRCLILRPGVVIGPYEYVGRLPWLLRRMHQGGEVLAAGDPGRPIQPIDVRDLAAFIITAISNRMAGAMNTTAPIGHATYGLMLDTCREVTGRKARLFWVDDQWLSAQDVEPWTEIPLWRTAPGAWAVTSARATLGGLTCRALTDTIADTWDWLGREDPIPHERAAEIGIDAAKERQLLSAWKRHLALTRR